MAPRHGKLPPSLFLLHATIMRTALELTSSDGCRQIRVWIRSFSLSLSLKLFGSSFASLLPLVIVLDAQCCVKGMRPLYEERAGADEQRWLPHGVWCVEKEDEITGVGALRVYKVGHEHKYQF